MDFFRLLEKLSDAHVEFVVIEGFAGVAHGCSLVTEDVDICMDFSVDNLLRFQKAVSGLHPVHRMTPKRIKLQIRRENCGDLKNLYLDTDYGQLDCLRSVTGIGAYTEVKACSQEIEIDGREYRILSLRSLIESKKAMGRPRDREAVIQLEAILDKRGDVEHADTDE